MLCVHCGEEIPERRLRVLPNTVTCVRCSNVKPKIGLQIFSHKSTSEIVVVETQNPENVRLAWNAYARAKGKNYNPVKKCPLRKCFE